MHHRVNDPNVISETIGDETIIVNLASGHYFSLQGANVAVWECLGRGYSVSDTVRYLTTRYDAADTEIESSVARLVAELEQEQLIVPTEGDPEPLLDAEPAPDEKGDRALFTMPPLSKFTDMQDIILLDPVHEVDQRGWPHAPAAG